MEKPLKIHEFAPRWHILNVPERYVTSAFTPSAVVFFESSYTHPLKVRQKTDRLNAPSC